MYAGTVIDTIIYEQEWVMADVCGVFVAKVCAALILFKFTHEYMHVNLQLRRLDLRTKLKIGHYNATITNFFCWFLLGTLICLEGALQGLFPSFLH